MTFAFPKPIPKTKHKYGARKTRCKFLNHEHPSGLEAAVCDILSLRVKANDIRNLKYQHTVELDYSIRWKIDWSFEQSPHWVLTFAEAKGKETDDFSFKLRMWKNGCAKGPLEMWRGTWQRPVLTEIIMPKGSK